MAKRTCSIEGCPKATVARGWCSKHWQRWKAHGDPEAKKNLYRESVWVRFWSKVDTTERDGCWTWSAYRDRDGYGAFTERNQHQVRAHRWAYEAMVGAIPEGLQLDHLCRNPPCVRPSHLEPVTSRENMARGIGPAALNLSKTHCKRGHPLYGDNLYLIRERWRACKRCRRDES